MLLTTLDDILIMYKKLFNSFDSKKWSNVLAVDALLFCLPLAIGRVERVFSQLKLIKNNRCTCLKENTLDHLIRIKTEGPRLADWDANRALEFWLSDKTRRVYQRDFRSQPIRSAPTGYESEEEESFSLEDWEEWISLYNWDNMIFLNKMYSEFFLLWSSSNFLFLLNSCILHYISLSIMHCVIFFSLSFTWYLL